jgi:plastocyanin
MGARRFHAYNPGQGRVLQMRPIPSRSPREGQHAGRAAGAAALAIVGMFVALPLRAARIELRLSEPDGSPLVAAVLYALPLDGRRLPAPAPARMDQHDRRFVPQILPVQTGAAVSFPNTDSISHHVYSFSAAKRFELYLPKEEQRAATRGRDGGGQRARAGSQEPSSQVTFDRPGVAALGCNIHDWMLAYILVVDTPWFTQTDRLGRAELADLPPGHYRLVVWHPRITDGAASLQREARVAAADAVSWEVRLRAPLLPARDQEPGFKDY